MDALILKRKDANVYR